MGGRRRALPLAIGLPLGAAVTLALMPAGVPGGAGALAAEDASQPLPIPETRLFDLGVTDYDGDRRLDVFSVNHAFPAAFLRNLGGGRFDDVTVEAGLSPTPRFPGLERVDSPPSFAAAGLYVYGHRRNPATADVNLELHAHGVAAAGTIVFDPRRRLRIEQGTATTARHGDAERVDFDLEAGGHLSLHTHLQLPVHLATDAPALVGSDAVPAGGGAFTLQLKDRHGYAFADLNGSGHEDLFAVLGGLGGDIAEAPWRGRLDDELLLLREGAYPPARLGLLKDDCRGRQAGAVDVDGDGRVDLFTSCEDSFPIAFVRTDDGFAREVIPAPGQVYRWVQIGPRRRPKLLALGRRASLWERRDGAWVRLRTAPLRGPASHATIADANGDGRVDVFVSSPRGSTLLRARGGRLRAQRPRRVGLPGRGSVASWVDVNGNGRTDLHAIPSGLHRQIRPGRFRATGRLRIDAPYGHLAWADLENRGLRDLIHATAPIPFAASHRIGVRRNPRRLGPNRRWLAVDSPGALQTSRIRVRAGGRTLTGWVGQSDDSRFSQAHNRVYFAVGRARSATISIRTPSGARHRLQTRTNRVVRLPRRGARAG